MNSTFTIPTKPVVISVVNALLFTLYLFGAFSALSVFFAFFGVTTESQLDLVRSDNFQINLLFCIGVWVAFVALVSSFRLTEGNGDSTPIEGMSYVVTLVVLFTPMSDHKPLSIFGWLISNSIEVLSLTFLT